MNEDLCTCNHVDGWQCTDGVPAGTNRRGPCACPCHLRKASQTEKPEATQPKAMLTSIPGDIPGLLLRGSPVTHPRRRNVPCVVVNITPAAAKVAYPWVIDGMAGDDWALRDLALDLEGEDGKTGRAHAAWWVAEQVERTAAGARSALTGIEFRAWEDATQNRSMTALAIDTLARLVLRLAGRS